MKKLVLALALGALPLVSCVGASVVPSLLSPCVGTCDRLYEPDDCGIQRAGRTTDELVEVCIEYCEDAWAESGEVGDYDPYTQTEGGAVWLENRDQVSVWAECVQATSCEDISDGYCAPVW